MCFQVSAFRVAVASLSLLRQPSAFRIFSLRDLWRVVTTRKNSPFVPFVIDEFHFVPSIPNGFVMFFFFFHNLPQDSLHDILNFAPTPPHKCLKNFPRAKTWFFFIESIKKKKRKKKKENMTKVSKFGYFTHTDPSLTLTFVSSRFTIDRWNSIIDHQHCHKLLSSYSMQDDNIWFQLRNEEAKKAARIAVN